MFRSEIRMGTKRKGASTKTLTAHQLSLSLPDISTTPPENPPRFPARTFANHRTFPFLPQPSSAQSYFILVLFSFLHFFGFTFCVLHQPTTENIFFVHVLVFSDSITFLPGHRSSVFQHSLFDDIPQLVFCVMKPPSSNSSLSLIHSFLVTLLFSPSTCYPLALLSGTSPSCNLSIVFRYFHHPPYSLASFFSCLQRFINFVPRRNRA